MTCSTYRLVALTMQPLVACSSGQTSQENSGSETEHGVGITFWGVDKVDAHPCRWERRTLQPGPTVRDLAEVLATRPLRDATEPTEIVVDGFEGLELEWSVPPDIDFSSCDEGSFYSWESAPGSWNAGRY